MRQTHLNPRPDWKRRGLALLLAFMLTLGLVPGFDLGGTGAAHWADAYLSQLVEWGFIRPDQSGSPEKELTRADFMAITNRAYGYHENGPTPFEDIQQTDWFYDDVGIAYTAKFIKGTSPTTASPNDTLTRETAATILGRNMMLQESAGEILDFTDARDISFWSKGVIKSSLEHYLIGGYDDGTFRPQRPVTWGEMAAMVTRIVGTPLQEAGDYSLGGVFGNVTISSPGVTLRDTVISGDLYVTGGVGLGDIKLENVTVLGRIICSGTGEAEGGQASIILRNVTADEMLIDNLQGKTVSVQADGITEIGKTTVRTSAYIEDNTPEGMGLHYVSLEGVAPDEDDPDFKNYEPPVLTVAGHIEEVVNKTPESLVHVAKGSVSKLTVDEAATDSQVTIDRNSEVKELNLDTATKVDGEGDIKHLNVNAPGCEVTILPEQITIRPGLTAEINGEEMDTTAAEESNQAPQILSGYPKAEDIAPTTMSAVFAANKKGTVYWAVSPVTNGSVGLDDLLKPPVYGSIAVANGSVKITKANDEVRAAVKKLTPGGSYYLSAVMVDERGLQSPVKVISFATPDNTVPAFCQGYPHMSSTSAQKGCQVVVMPTKSCNLYYALLPKGAKAPTEDEFKANSVSGALGFGVVPVTKNTESVIRVDDVTLEEQKEYVLYLWLVDADGMNKSKITSLTFVTDDETLPFFIVQPTVNKVQANSVGLNFRLSEAGTVYWAVVPAGTEYPKKQPGHDSVNLSDEWAKLQVQNGYSAFKSGKVAAALDKDGTITVSGLDPETAYELYYVAVDKAGNYSAMVQHMTINTLDQTGPTISQIFTKYSGLDNTTNPMVDTDIILRVSENVRSTVEGAGEDLLSLYQASVDRTASEMSRKESRDKLVLSLRNSLTLNQVTAGTGRGSRPAPVKGDTGVDDNWVIDYEKVTVALKDKALEITFPAEGLQMDSGSTYYFTAQNLTDVSDAQNPVVPSPVDFYTNAATGQAAGHDLRVFTIMLGQFYLTRIGLDSATEMPTKGSEKIPVDFSFRAVPQSTSKMDNNMCWDMLFFTDSVIAFDLYYRVVKVDSTGNNPTPVDLGADTRYQLPNWQSQAVKAGDAGWYKINAGGSELLRGSKANPAGVTLNGQFCGCDQGNYPKLNRMDDGGQTYYEFAITITQKDSSTTRTEWSGDVNLSVHAAAAPSTNLSTLTRRPSFDRWDDTNNTAITPKKSFIANGLANGGGVSIGITDQSQTFLSMDWPFTDSRIPRFDTGFPHIEPGDTFVDMELALDQTSSGSTISYVIAPVGGINPRVLDHRTDPNSTAQLSAADLWDDTPLNGSSNQPGLGTDATPKDPAAIISPEKVAIAEHMYNNDAFKMDTIPYGGNNERVPKTEKGLMPKTDYYIYFVFSNSSGEMSDIYMYRFTTNDISKPMIELSRANGIVNARTHVNSVMDYTMATASQVRTMEQFSNDPNFKLKEHAISTPDNKKIPDKYLEMSILDAMIAPYTINLARENVAPGANLDDYYIPDYSNSTSTLGYSVFDVYARDSIKETVAQLIRSGSSITGYVASGTKNTSTAPTAIDERSKMTAGSVYMVLTVAHHESGLTDSFKVVDNVVLPDETPPYPIDITTYIPDDGVKDGQTGKLYKGRVTITFNKDLYWLPTNASSSTLAQPVFATNTRNPEGGVSILDKITSTASKITVGDDLGDSKTSVFVLDFENMSVNGQIILFPVGLISSSGGTAETRTLTLTFTTTKSDVGFTSNWKPAPSYHRHPISQQEAKLEVTNAGPGINLVGSTLTFTSASTETSSTSSLFATVTDSNPDGYNYTWESRNPTVATVTPATGRKTEVTAVGMGKTEIIVKGGPFTQVITVTVGSESDIVIKDGDVPVTKNSTISTIAGTNKTLTYTSANFPAYNMIWTSSNPSAVEITPTTNSGGMGGSAIIKPKNTGNTTLRAVISVTTADGSMTVKNFTVLVEPKQESDSGLSIMGVNKYRR